MKYLLCNILGIFVFDDLGNVIDSKLFTGIHEYEARQHYLEQFRKKHAAAEITHDNPLLKIFLAHFKDSQYFPSFYAANLELTKQQIKNSVSKDQLLIQAANTSQDIEKILNQLVKRLREWYELYNPETSKAIANHEKFVQQIIKKSKQELLGQQGLSENDSMGAALEKDELHAIMNLAHHAQELYAYQKSIEEYIKSVMEELCPNLLAVAGSSIGSKLLQHAGSLERLAILPASTIQILGAEKALFRHLTRKAKMPKYGVIFQHPLIAKVKHEDRGKAARALADKLSIAVKVDRFKGKQIAEQLLHELQERFGQWK